MHIFLDNFHQDGKCNAQISLQQTELKWKENVTNQKYLSINSLQTDDLNLDISSGSGKSSERKKIVKKNSLSVEVVTILQINVSKG